MLGPLVVGSFLTTLLFMPLENFRPLNIVDSFIPGSLRKAVKDNAPVFRTIHQKSLNETVADLALLTQNVDNEIALGTCVPGSLLAMIKDSGCLKRGQPAGKNVADLIALGVVGAGVAQEHGCYLVDLAVPFLSVKLKYLQAFKSALGADAVYISESLLHFNFDEAQSCTDISNFLRSSGINSTPIFDFIRDNLSIVILHTKSVANDQVFWRQTIIPNITGATDDQMVGQISLFYEAHRLEETRGSALSADDLRNLKDVIPSECRELVDYLIFKYCANEEIKTTLNLHAGESLCSSSR